ncbi:MAG TPA: NAD(+) synthase [Anaerolineae bacterium]|nr:NAD(+) synthase [Anaerolineae bacterium]HOQ99537.1 NAD(+) synthase [Anaerolineae bacterium]HPL28157.1 NAD(+) synthase [Anaerolineae bacterium]
MKGLCLMGDHAFPPASLGYLRVAAVSPELRVADVRFNARAIISALQGAAAHGCRLALFPELCLTGYSCADLFGQALLREAALAALVEVAEATARLGIAAVVGLPFEVGGRLFNCAAFLAEGQVLGLVPKSFLPNSNEYYEARWFTPAGRAPAPAVALAGAEVPFGADLLFAADNLPGCTVGIEVCEDLWSVSPPSQDMALAGATLLLNPSAGDELLGKVDYRRALVCQQSGRCLAAYLYAGAGAGESTTDVVYSGHSLIAENSTLLAETARFRFSTEMALADVDVERLVHERLRNSSFSAATPRQAHRVVGCHLPEPATARAEPVLLRPLSQTPFVAADPAQRAEHLREILRIQSTGLAKRLRHIGAERVTLGVSGGLDSTLALLVTLRAFDALGLARSGIVAISMPGLGTTARTRANAERLAELLGVTLRRIPIDAAVRQHFADIDHDEAQHDLTYENAQARERTQILMDVANQVGGLVVGTGDLSELALGWATYNGDHMSMYHINAGVPKTLVRYLVEWAAEHELAGEAAEVVRDICATPITPELLPPDADGALQQETELTIGPYALHDFFLYYTVRHQFAPRKVLFLAQQAFGDAYAPADILRWLAVFYRRFIGQQFKRSAMPDGPKVGSVALSPRGDWRMPSDASNALWVEELEQLKREFGS